ncbi:MAG: hypothetical protein JNK87_40805 [Bryobacterales bacterium]|nr:hypothetical protein [Bryobacterales bacterium]
MPRRNLPDCLNPNSPAAPWRVPLDENDLAVRLETDGVTETVARLDFGFDGTLAMASQYYPECAVASETLPAAKPAPSQWREHLKGTVFALPLALCSFCMLVFNFSLWGGDLSAGMAAAIALGTVASFVMTGGLVQAMAWQGLFYAGSADFRMTLVTCRRWCTYGVAILAGTSVAAAIGNASFRMLETPLLATMLAFYVLLGLMWLSSGILYMLEEHLRVSAAVALGLAVVVLLRWPLGLPLVSSQIGGLVCADITAFFLAWRCLKARAGHEPSRKHPQMVGRTLYFSAPYLVYGVCYYLLIFIDRVLAWTAQTESAVTPVIFRGDYELPLDIALIGFIAIVGWVHSSMVAFYARVQLEQPRITAAEAGKFNFAMQAFYLWRVIYFLPVAYLVCMILWIAAVQAGFLATPLTQRIAMIALLGYPWLALGLWNVSLLFALSIPSAVVLPVVAAVLADGATGYVLSRVLSYDWAVVGFLIGTVVFGTGSGLAVHRRFRRLDYFYFVSGA